MYCQSWMNCAAVPLLHQNQPFGWYSWNGAHNTADVGVLQHLQLARDVVELRPERVVLVGPGREHVGDVGGPLRIFVGVRVGRRAHVVADHRDAARVPVGDRARRRAARIQIIAAEDRRHLADVGLVPADVAGGVAPARLLLARQHVVTVLAVEVAEQIARLRRRVRADGRDVAAGRCRRAAAATPPRPAGGAARSRRPAASRRARRARCARRPTSPRGAGAAARSRRPAAARRARGSAGAGRSASTRRARRAGAPRRSAVARDARRARAAPAAAAARNAGRTGAPRRPCASRRPRDARRAGDAGRPGDAVVPRCPRHPSFRRCPRCRPSHRLRPRLPGCRRHSRRPPTRRIP